MKQLIGGYVIENFYSKLAEEKGEAFTENLKKLAVFDFKTNIERQDHSVSEAYRPFVRVLINLISRGMPTRMPLTLERRFAHFFHLNEKLNSIGGISFEAGDKTLVNYKEVEQAFHVIDPRINAANMHRDYKKSWENELGSEYEEMFLYETLPRYFGKDKEFLLQLIEPQRSVESLLKNSEVAKWLQERFPEQRLDFVLEFPAPINEKKGFIIEVDGSQHEEQQQKLLDDRRDKATFEHGWEKTIRLKTKEKSYWPNQLSVLDEYLSYKPFRFLERNYTHPLYEHDKGLAALELALVPLAIARCQRALLELIEKGYLDLKAKIWRIAVIERDVPCAELAVGDLREQFRHLIALTNEDLSLPEIELTVYNTPEFTQSSLKTPETIDISEVSNDPREYHTVLDISVLRRSTIDEEVIFPVQPDVYATIRSVKSVHGRPKVHTDSLIKYRSITTKAEDQQYIEHVKEKEHLEYFLQYIFRKKSFRPGQLPILNRALQLESVIGLLPTGGGKSLTYQLAALLQPGLTMVIDPIKSLMKDQVDGLKGNLIDSCTYLNSSLNAQEKKEAETAIMQGDSLFIFISPERLQIARFRKMLNELSNRDLWFSYFIIDEAHCVSEWGHDFRTSYLSLGDNARRHCKPKNKVHLPIFALTATASFDVLADIQRELSPMKGDELSDEVIVRFETTKRDELQFRVIQLSVRKEIETLKQQSKNKELSDWDIKTELGKKKQAVLNQLLQNLPDEFKKFNEEASLSFNTSDGLANEAATLFHKIQIPDYRPESFFDRNNQNAGVIFCPHRSWYFGVTDMYKLNSFNSAPKGVFDNVNVPVNKGTYMGSDDEDQEKRDYKEKLNIENQDKFKQNKLGLLVSTKAFGMGIDKPNIRYTVHVNYPQSIESFVQEAGRAGRDRKLAISYILFNDEDLLIHNHQNHKELPPAKIPVDKELLLYFHNISFKGQEKEKRTLYELLTEIHYPATMNLSSINFSLRNEFDFEGEVNYWFSKNTGRSYLFIKKSQSSSYGTLRLPELIEDYSKATEDIIECQRVVSQVKATILRVAPKEKDLIQWLTTEITKTSEGIEKILARQEEGELIVGFKTNWDYFLRSMARVISQECGYEVTVQMLYNNMDSTLRGLLENLDKSLSKKNKEMEGMVLAILGKDNIQERLQNIFFKLRDKSDTEKAIYRLSILGVVDDYEVDFASETFVLKLKRYTDEQYLLNLRRHILKYYSNKRADEIIAQIPNRPGNSTIQKCLNYLIEFIYEEVEKKRFRAIDDMNVACREGVEKGNLHFKEFIDLYFHSKYARSKYKINEVNASLLDQTDKGKEEDIQIVWRFIDFVNEDGTGSQVDNMKHLRGACLRILVSNPDNYSLLLLKAFAEMILELNRKQPSEKQLEEAAGDFSKGFLRMRKTEVRDAEVLLNDINHFGNLLMAQCPKEAETIVEDIIEYLKLRIHSSWLQEYNQMFNADDKRPDTPRTAQFAE